MKNDSLALPSTLRLDSSSIAIPLSSPLATTEEGRPIRTTESCSWTLANPTFICFNSDLSKRHAFAVRLPTTLAPSVSRLLYDSPYDFTLPLSCPSSLLSFQLRKSSYIDQSTAVINTLSVVGACLLSLPLFKQMPVPVPRTNRPTAYPVIKHNPAQTKAVHTISATPNRLQSLPSWKRKSHSCWQESLLPPAQYSVQDFYKGLAAAENAPVIKGAHAEACIPPKYKSIFLSQMIKGTLPSDDQSNWEVDGDYAMNSHRLSLIDQPQFHDSSSWDTNHLINHQGCGSLQEDWPDYLYKSSFEVATNAAPVNDRLLHRAISPNPDSSSGHDSGSSPMEPITPFVEFIDRAVTTPQYSISDDEYADSSATHECYQDTQAVLNACQAPPVFPSIAEPPPKHQPIVDTVTPSTTFEFKKLSGPLADWVANYVWKTCTTGLSLPPSFSQSL